MSTADRAERYVQPLSGRLSFQTIRENRLLERPSDNRISLSCLRSDKHTSSRRVHRVVAGRAVLVHAA